MAFKPEVYGDERGFFMEASNTQRYEGFGILADYFVQVNLSYPMKA